jgi:predicted ATP-grasp superfamily ATP-dependent carboligase
VLAVSAERGPLLRSRYCRIDRVLDSEARLLELLDDVGSRMPDKGVLIPTGDGEVLFLLKHRSRLGAHFHFRLPDSELVERLANKRFQYEYAASLGVPVPQTYFPENTQQLRRIAASLSYPCIIKPCYAHLWRSYRRRVAMRDWAKAAQVDTPEQLEACYDRMSAGGVELLVQERIEGEESRLYSVYLYLNAASEPLASFVLQKRRQWPPVYGNGSYSISCRQDESLDLSVKLLEGLRYQGIANVEFKHDPKDGKFKLIEVNLRCGNRVGLAIECGVDIPHIAYRDMLGETPLPAHRYEVGVAWIDLLADWAGFSHYHATENLTLWEWARSAWAAKSHAYFAVDDPLPWCAHLWRTAKGAAASRYRRS